MTLQPGDLLKERYRIVKPLSRGGFGAVYRAVDLKLDRACAIKENLDSAPEAGRQFVREARILAQLNHPHLPAVLDYFHTPGQSQYLVMQYISGEDLAVRVMRRGRLDEEETLRWVEDTASALICLHAQNPPIIHRDVKPGNIRLAYDEHTGRQKAVLVDFGLAKLYDPHVRTALVARAVTPGYSPPEQYGGGTTDARSDVYALGATVYYLLSARQPPESTTRLFHDNLESLEQIVPEVSERVSKAVQRAMVLKPNDRFQTVSDFIHALRSDEEPVLPPAGSMKVTREPVKVEQPRARQVIRPISELPVQEKPPPDVAPKPATAALPPRPKTGSTSILPWIILVVLVFALIFVVSSYLVENLSPAGTALPPASNAGLDATGRPLPTEGLALSPTSSFPVAGTLPATPAVVPTSLLLTTFPTAVATPLPAPSTTTPDVAQAATLQTARARFDTLAGAWPARVLSSLQVEQLALDAQGQAYRGWNVGNTDMVAGIRFFNPEVGSSGQWEYGIIFRHTQDQTEVPPAAGQGIRLALSSTGQWSLTLPDGQSQSGVVELNLGSGRSNDIRLLAQGPQGWLLVNDRYFFSLDLSGWTERGHSFWIFANADVSGAVRAVGYRGLMLNVSAQPASE